MRAEATTHMRMLVRWRSRFFESAILMLYCLALAGCSTPVARKSQANSGFAQTPESQKTHLLYLLPSPHSRLYVEVDAVEGCAPKDIALQKLKEFLSAHCDKPDGIEVVRSDVIPKKAARGISPRALARRYIDGPDKTNASPPAFMYVLYYARRPGTAIPYTETYPYPAIYLNTRFSLGLALNEILLHETGHLLGLVSRPVHARKGHCRNRGCQMNTHWAYLREFSWLPGRKQSPLCAECVAELGQSATQAPLPNLRYIGPVLVRSEVDYHVLSLPGRLLLLVGDFSDERCANFADRVHAEAPGADGRSRVICLARSEVLDDRARVNEIIDRFKNDAFEVVRRDGPKALLRACVGRYES